MSFIVPAGRRTRLLVSENVTLDGAGAGEVVLGPVATSERWEIARLSIRVTADDPMPRCFVFDGSANVTNQIDDTYVGAQNTSDMGAYGLDGGEFLTVRWEGGQAGAVATATIAGARYTVG